MFFVGYTVTNVCGGYLAARHTAKLVLGLGVLSYSIFTILMPVAASSKSVYVVLACACLMGAGEGVIFPAIQHLQGKWLPPRRRTFANTLLFAGKPHTSVVEVTQCEAVSAAASFSQHSTLVLMEVMQSTACCKYMCHKW